MIEIFLLVLGSLVRGLQPSWLSRFGRRLGLVIIAICVLIFVLLAFKAYVTSGLSEKLFVSFLVIAISLEAAAVPTALPALVTITAAHRD